MGITVHIDGRVRVLHLSRTRKIKALVEGVNIVTEGAFELIAQHLGGGAAVLPTHIAIGTGGDVSRPNATGAGCGSRACGAG